MWDNIELAKASESFRFNKSNLEKVHRLMELLKILNNDKELKDMYVLKGGTAINLCLYDFPRLSVDIDMNYNRDCTRDEMLKNREKNNKIINIIARQNNYIVSDKSRYSHILDSFVLNYTNLDGRPDNIKLEMNYINRIMIFDPVKYEINSDIFGYIQVLALNKIELYGSKIAALIGRTTARDVYDVNKMIEDKQIHENEIDSLRYCSIFYLMTSNDFLSLETLLDNFKINLDYLDEDNISKNLIPMLHIDETLDINLMKKRVLNFVTKLLQPNEREKAFIKTFIQGEYKPELLFDKNLANRLIDHPMAKWKMITYQTYK